MIKYTEYESCLHTKEDLLNFLNKEIGDSDIVSIEVIYQFSLDNKRHTRYGIFYKAKND